MLKFRTMHWDVPKYKISPNSPEDSRITRVGRFLRRTSLDELPQLWNVLRWDMSLVGPRPEMPFIVGMYSGLHLERLNVRPGMTGLWQVSGQRKFPIHHHIDYDIYYIYHQSLLLDIIIMMKTAICVIRGENTY